jgi:creatinine amidohydrolase
MRMRALALLTLASLSAPALAAQQPARDGAGPIEAGQSLWTEELSWWEIRDLMAKGYTTVIIGTGGVEQNGPFVASGKHNFVLATVLPYIARQVPNSLIAPIVKFVPEGRIEPTGSGHMSYQGTIGLEQATYEALLTDIARSYKTHGFKDIILIGDSGGNQTGLRNVANALNERWTAENSPARVHFLPEYYSEDQWSCGFLRSQGIVQVDSLAADAEGRDRCKDTRNGMHDDIYYEAQIAVQNPELIRVNQRMKAGMLSLHGVKYPSVEWIVDVGKKLAEYRAGIVARAFQASQQRLRGN